MRRVSLLHLSATIVTLLAVARLLVLPWFHDRSGRGDYLFGHYSLEEIYVGFPLLALAVVFTLLWLVPKVRRRVVGARMVGLTISCLAAVACFDLGYALLLRGALKPQYWLDTGHISRADNDPDADFGFVRKPHAQWKGRVPGTDRVVEYRADSKGFRNDVELTHADLAFVGDSYTEAAQVDRDQSFAALVGEKLGKSVANLGRGAYGPQQEALVIERFALALGPEWVVWQFFDGNDLHDAQEYADWKRDGGPVAPLRERYFGNSYFEPLLQETYLSKKGDFALLHRDDGSELPFTVRYRWMPHQTRERSRGWEETERSLKHSVEMCRAAKARVLVVFVPVAARVLRSRIEYRKPSDAEVYAPSDAPTGDDFAAAMARSCSTLGVDFLDLTETFEAALQGGADGIFIPRDEHLDLRGHRLAADAIAAWLSAPR
ncbi:MAG: GDSL-type esterase/lipase family protein [Planctomycetota bacterium]